MSAIMKFLAGFMRQWFGGFFWFFFLLFRKCLVICVKLLQFERYCASEEIPCFLCGFTPLLREVPCVHIYFLYKIYLKMLITRSGVKILLWIEKYLALLVHCTKNTVNGNWTVTVAQDVLY